MTKIGMIGGFGPESTLDYYNLLIQTHRNEINSTNNPDIIIYSMDINKLMELVAKEQWDELVEWLLNGINVLHNAGADFAFISANTPHIVFDRVEELAPIPLLSIVKETCNYMKKIGIKRAGLLGTKFTMQSDFYKKTCNKNNIEIFVPSKKEQDYIHEKLMTEIELGNFLNETREELLNIIERLIDNYSIECLILGCTELPLILTKDEFNIPFLNTTKIHVESILKYYERCKA